MARNGRRIARNCQVLATLAVGLTAAFTIGCDDCDVGEVRCEGDVLRVCRDANGDGPFATAYWEDSKCPLACLQFGSEAHCVDPLHPAAECGNTASTLRLCRDGYIWACWQGYAVPDTSCDFGTHCEQSTSCGAICVVGDAPDPRCSQKNFCDGSDAAVLCECDFVKRRSTCGNGSACQAVSGEAACTQSATTDSRCGDPTQRTSGFCADGFAYGCWYGYVASSFDCKGVTCVETPGQAASCPQVTYGPQP